MAWWIWMVLGCVLLMAETLTPGHFFFFFFGIGAVMTGAVAAIGIANADWLQWLMFSVLSLLFLIFFRSRLRAALYKRSGPPTDVDGLVGLSGKASIAMAVNEMGTVEMRGAQWNARNVGAMPLSAGQRCTIEKVDGLTLLIKAEK